MVKSGVPVMLNSMVSAPEPAIHSPPVTPEAVSVLAAVIASRSVHSPSSAVVSAVELTVMVDAAWTCTVFAAVNPSIKNSASPVPYKVCLSVLIFASVNLWWN